MNADIAHAVARYTDATGDDQFDGQTGCDLLVHTARLWASLGHLDGSFRIDGVTGPDEYSALADNNIFTNLMAQQNLRAAADAVKRHPERAGELQVSPEEVAAWRAAADRIVLPYDEKLGVHCQAEGFTEHEVWDFAATGPDQRSAAGELPLLRPVPQAGGQASRPGAGHAAHPGRVHRRAEGPELYLLRGAHRPGFLPSACSQAVIAAETGHLDLAYDYLAETALMDIDDLEHNTRDGLHIAALAGSWIALVQGFGGMRYRPGQPTSFAPRLPPALTRLTFTVMLRGRHLRVEVRGRPASPTSSTTTGPRCRSATTARRSAWRLASRRPGTSPGCPPGRCRPQPPGLGAGAPRPHGRPNLAVRIT